MTLLELSCFFVWKKKEPISLIKVVSMFHQSSLLIETPGKPVRS